MILVCVIVVILFSMALVVLSRYKKCPSDKMCIRDRLVTDTKLFQFQLKERGFIGALRQEAVRKLGDIVRLDTFNEIRALFHNMAQEGSRGIGAVLLKRCLLYTSRCV